jgi:predicted HTH domain antitoxin
MLLSEEMENEFIASSDIYSSLNSEKMVATRGEKMLAKTPFGKFLKKAIASEAKIAKIEAETAKIEAETAKIEAETAKIEAEKEAMREKMVLAFVELNVSVEKIAELVERDVDYVKEIIKKDAEKNAIKCE